MYGFSINCMFSRLNVHLNLFHKTISSIFFKKTHLIFDNFENFSQLPSKKNFPLDALCDTKTLHTCASNGRKNLSNHERQYFWMCRDILIAHA